MAAPAPAAPAKYALNMKNSKGQKMEVDYSSMVDVEIPKLVELGKKPGKLNEAIEGILALEKTTRQGEDELSTHKLCLAIVKMCHDLKNWEALNTGLVTISKRRGQFPQTIVKVVDEAMTYIDGLPTKELKLTLIDNLRLITAGKMFVEVQRARLTLILAKMKEAEGGHVEAAELMQEVQVETLGAMDKREKTNFILEQMRLCLARKDYIRTNIISRKITTRALSEEGFQDLKLRYHNLMIQYYLHEKQYLDMTRSYLAIYDTSTVKAEEAQWKAALRNASIYVVLAKHDTDQQSLLHRIYTDKELSTLPQFKALLKTFVTQEVANWPSVETAFRRDLLEGHTAFTSEGGRDRWTDLQKRVTEHNIRVISQYYERITVARLAEMLTLAPSEAETYVSEMVVDAAIYARINRPAGIIVFAKPQAPNDTLNEWATSVGKLLHLVDQCSHNIQKENMMAAAAKAAAEARD